MHKKIGIIYIIIGCLCLYGNIHQFIDASQLKNFFYFHIPLNIFVVIIGILLIKLKQSIDFKTIDILLKKADLLLDNVDNVVNSLDSLEIICKKNKSKISKTFIAKLNYFYKYVDVIIHELELLENKNFVSLISNLEHQRAKLEENIDRLTSLNSKTTAGNNDTK